MANPQCDFQPNTRCATFLTHGQTLGLIITAEAGFLSAAAVLFLFCMITRNIIRNVRNPPEGGWRLFKTPLDVYMLSLFISDFIQGLGIFFNIRWVIQGSVKCGTYCTVQGMIQQLGETSVALATLAIAVHTFIIILFRKDAKGIVFPSIVVSAIWLYVTLFVAISAATHRQADDEFYTPTPYWCWVGARFNGERIAGEYFWLWFTALVSLALYVPLFFCLRGNIEVEKEPSWKLRFRRQPNVAMLENGAIENLSDTLPFDNRPQASKTPAMDAFIMLLYPVCYVALILPLSIVRWITFVLEARHPPDPNNIPETIPSAATFVVISIFGLSGLVNVILVLMTRPGLLLLSDSVQRSTPRPILVSSASVVSSVKEPENVRLRAFNPALLMAEIPR